MRAFIAVNLPETITKGLNSMQRQMEKTKADVSWVRPKSLHLTLKFLGEIDNAQLAMLKENLPAVCGKHTRFGIDISCLGAFPDLAFPRIIWAGIGANADKLTALAVEIESALTAAGFAPEARPFAAHITLGRVRSNRGRKELSAALENIKGQPQTMQLAFPVDSLTLYKSTLTPAGPLYETLATINLKIA